MILIDTGPLVALSDQSDKKLPLPNEGTAYLPSGSSYSLFFFP
jgi:hypothetical protein